LKATPACPLADVELVITGAGGLLTVMAKLAEPVPPALVALIVALVVPVAEGVPEITPLLVFTVRPAGKPDALKLVGLFEAVIW
jgi:hypothetical protein